MHTHLQLMLYEVLLMCVRTPKRHTRTDTHARTHMHAHPHLLLMLYELLLMCVGRLDA